MANIDITVSNGLYGIVLDQWDWTSLTVVDNGQNHTIQKENEGWAYTQTVEGPIKFAATADGVGAANPGAMMILAGTNQSHLCAVVYTAQDSDNPFTLTAVCCNVPTGVKPTESSPILFSQSGMTGEFKQG